MNWMNIRQCHCRKSVGLLLLFGVAAIMISGCSASHSSRGASGTADFPQTGSAKPYKVMGKWYTPLPHADGFRQKGLASWYGKKFHGRKTSNGETYNMYAMTAAHKILPLGTYVRVHNFDNGKQIIVRINDRGPFVSGRIIDLSYTAAKELGVIGPGTAPVEVVALSAHPVGRQTVPKEPRYDLTAADHFTFQVGAFKSRDNAVKLMNRLASTYDDARIAASMNGAETVYRVRLGKCSSLQEVQVLEQRLIQDGFRGAFVVAE